MKIEKIFQILEGTKEKQAFIKLTDGTEISPIIFGTSANDYGDMFLVVSDEKSKRKIPIAVIEDISFPEL